MMDLMKKIEGKISSEAEITRRLYFLTTFVIYLGNIALGCGMAFFLPLVVDFAIKYETGVDQISFIFTISVIAYLMGALLVSFLYRFISRQFGVFVFQTLMAMGLCLTPHCPTLMYLYAVCVILGFCYGAYDTSQIVWVMEMWQAESGPFIQGQHFSFAIGGLIPGILMAPFLSQESVDPMLQNSTDETHVPQHSTQIWIPVTILAIPATLTAAAQLMLYIFKPYVAPVRENCATKIINVDYESEVGNNEKSGLKYLKLKLIILSAIFCGFEQAMEMITAQFISTFAQFGEHELSQSQGSLMLTAFMVPYTIGRAIGILVILKIPPRLILAFNLVILLLGNSILCVPNLAVWGLWLVVSLIGLGYSTVYACFYAYIERHLAFTDWIGSVMLVSAASVGSIYTIIVGQQIQHNPIVLTYVNFFSISVVFVTFILICKLTFRGRLLSCKT